MGGGSYDRDVGSVSSDSGYDYSAYTTTAQQAIKNTSVNSDVLPKDRKLICEHKSPIVIAIDGTGSMGQDAYIIYDKMPMFYGQIIMQGYLEDPAVSFAVVGDVYSDRAPIQICDFEQGTELDNWLKKLWLEGGGGGQGKESYELTGYFYARHCELRNAEKPFFFFIGDEGFYPILEEDYIYEHIGERPGNIEAKTIFKELNQKFNLFLIHKMYGSKRDDKNVVDQWKEVINPERILILEEPKAIVDVMLGAIAIVSKTRDLDNYLVDMKGRGQTEQRIALVEKTLTSLSESTSLVKVETKGKLPTKSDTKRTKGKSKRL